MNESSCTLERQLKGVVRLRRTLTDEYDALRGSRDKFLYNKRERQARFYTSDDAASLVVISKGIAVRRAQLKLLESYQLRFIQKYNPDQPRVPAGQPEGGQWTSSAGGAAVDLGDSSNDISNENIGNVDITSTPIPKSGMATLNSLRQEALCRLTTHVR